MVVNAEAALDNPVDWLYDEWMGCIAGGWVVYPVDGLLGCLVGHLVDNS